ncbi:MAG TPA: hypothetical protein VIV60_08170, partial [Polyangiaceae bacterium]
HKVVLECAAHCDRRAHAMIPARVSVFSVAWFAMTGCLPDPPAYDPCSDDQSQYYAVAPTGCDGHELQVLYSDERHLVANYWEPQPDGTAMLGGLSLSVPSRLVMDDTDLYWFNLSGVHRTSKDRSHQATLLEVPTNAAAAVGLSRDGAALYVLTIGRSDDANPGESALIGVPLPDRAGSEAPQESLFLSDTAVRTILPVEDGFIFVDDSQSLKRVSLVDTDVEVIVDGPISSFTASTDLVYYLRSNDDAIRSLDLVSGEEQVLFEDAWLTHSQTQLITVGDGIAYYTCSSGYDSCEWNRVTHAGEAETIARNIAYGTLASVADDQAFVAVAAMVNDEFSSGSPGLYSWSLSDHSRTKLAKPFAMVGGLVVDAQYVYVSETSSDTVELDDGGSEIVITERLLRVRR